MLRLMPVDDRDDLDRLSRAQLYREAEAQGISFAAGLPKYEWDAKGNISGGMVPLLRSHGITRFNMKAVKWFDVQPTDQERAAAAHHGQMTSAQSYPVREMHQSKRDGVDSSALLQARLSDTEDKNDAQAAEILRLRAEVKNRDDLLERLAKRLDEEDAAKKDYWAVKRIMDKYDIPWKRGMKLDEMEALINAHDLASGRESGTSENGAD